MPYDKVEDITLSRLRTAAKEFGSKSLIAVLEELLERRKNDKPDSHEALSWKESKVGIYAVQCTCGEVTEHRVPLTNIEDFKCPKSPVKE